MDTDDRERWNLRYQREGAIAKPDPIITRLLSEIGDAGRAVDLGAGYGRYSLWLARRGWHVDAYDISDVAADALSAQAAAERLDQLHVMRMDLEEWDPMDAVYDLGLMIFYWSDRVLARLRRAIKPGGHLILRAHLAGQGGQSGRFQIESGELARRFADWDIWWIGEDPGTGVASVAARKPGVVAKESYKRVEVARE